MEEKKYIKISLKTAITVIAIIAIMIMGVIIYTLRNKNGLLKEENKYKMSNNNSSVPIVSSAVKPSTNAKNIPNPKKRNEENTVKNNDVQNGNQELKEVVNNGGYFVKYGSDIYYWKLNNSSRENVALYGKYKEISNAKNELIKRDKDGKETVVIKENGYGKIFIADEKIFLSYAKQDSYDNVIYSINFDGKNKKEYKDGIIKYVTDDEIICQSSNKEIFKINSKTDKVTILKQKAGYLGCTSNKIFYVDLEDNIKYDNNNKYSGDQLAIGCITNNQESRTIATIKKSEFKNSDEVDQMIIDGFWIENNRLNLYVNYKKGSANQIQEEIHVTMDENGNNMRINHLEIKEGGEVNYDYINEDEILGKLENEKIFYYKGSKQIISKDEIANKFNLQLSQQDYLLEMIYAEIIDKEVFIMVDYNIYSQEDSIGWRDAYKRLKTIVFKYDIENKEITKIYEIEENEGKEKNILKPTKKVSKLFRNSNEAEEYVINEKNIEDFYGNEVLIGDNKTQWLETDYKASSTHSEDVTDYKASNLNNFFVDSCWCEGVDGEGIGETIEVNAFTVCEQVYLYASKNKER